MMKNSEKYAVAVRKPDGEIELMKEEYKNSDLMNRLSGIPFVRGVFNFVDSLRLGMKCLNFSASFYEDEEETQMSESKEKLVNTLVTVVSFALAIGIFIVLPYFLSSFFQKLITNSTVIVLLEGVIRIGIFLGYVSLISLLEDIRRLYQYHGAEHKCINCLERGKPLTVENVKESSRLHKRCGTSFIFFVMLVSIVLFFFIRVDNVLMKVGLRLLLLPVVAGISYEIIRLAGRSENVLVKIISAPGMLIQRMTTKEPDEKMIEVAIAAVEAVFDWRHFLQETFGIVCEDQPAKEENMEASSGGKADESDL
ncbi:MAG: DUF1385 domain-containing protein [Acetatifactor sp.]